MLLLDLLPVQELTCREPKNVVNCTPIPPTRGRRGAISSLVAFLIFLSIFSSFSIFSIFAAALEPRTHARQFASGVKLVEVYVTVTDAQAQPVTGLTAADFRVFEDDEPQAIAAFTAGEFPLSVALAIDRSFSMKGQPIALAKAGVRAFASALRPADQMMILAIGGETTIVAPLSTYRAAALAAMERLEVWGTTPLYDATIAAIGGIQEAAGRRALILLSDGTDRYSSASAADVVERARASDVLLYPIAIGRSRPPIFAELATVTGGRSFFLSDPRELRSTLTTISRELRAQYLLGYSSSRGSRGRTAEPEWRSIRVALSTRSGVRIRHRTGYFAR